MKPLVSVVTPLYNHERYIEETIKSVLDQTIRDLEIIVVDDGSTDNGFAICKQLRREDPRIIILKQNNSGLAVARNAGLKIARGKYIAILDSDDFMPAIALEQQLHEFSKDKSYDIIYTAIYVVDAGGKVMKTIRGREEKRENFLAKTLFRNLMPNLNSFLAKKKCFEGNNYDQRFVCAEDYAMTLTLACNFYLHYLDQPLRYYRRHSTNMSGDLQKQRAGELQVIKSFSLKSVRQIVDSCSLSAEEKSLLFSKIIYNQERFNMAIDYFLQLSHLPTINFYLGNCFYKKGDFRKAISYYKKAIINNPEDPASLNNLGIVYAKRGEFAAAKDCFEKALNLKSDYLDPKKNLAHMEKASNFTFKELRPTIMPYR